MDQDQPRTSLACSGSRDLESGCVRRRDSEKLRPWTGRVLCWETVEGKLEVRKKSDVQDEGTLSISAIRYSEVDIKVFCESRTNANNREGCYLRVPLPENWNKSQVRLLFDCREKSDIRTDSDIPKAETEGVDQKIYLPFVTLYLKRLDLLDKMRLRTGKLDKTLYVHKTGILDDGSHVYG